MYSISYMQPICGVVWWRAGGGGLETVFSRYYALTTLPHTAPIADITVVHEKRVRV